MKVEVDFATSFYIFANFNNAKKKEPVGVSEFLSFNLQLSIFSDSKLLAVEK
jgi:hypothetical protein